MPYKDPAVRKAYSKRWRTENRDRFNAYFRELRRQNPTRERHYKLRRAFGMSLDDYNRMLASQNGKCAICGAAENKSGRPLPVDHDHKTNKVRAILCEDCNRGLGGFRDNLTFLTNAIAYLEKYHV